MRSLLIHPVHERIVKTNVILNSQGIKRFDLLLLSHHLMHIFSLISQSYSIRSCEDVSSKGGLSRHQKDAQKKEWLLLWSIINCSPLVIEVIAILVREIRNTYSIASSNSMWESCGCGKSAKFTRHSFLHRISQFSPLHEHWSGDFFLFPRGVSFSVCRLILSWLAVDSQCLFFTAPC